jgi:Abortive infection alpha
MDDDQKEILKVGAEAALKPFTSLIEKLFGGAVEQIGGAWEDRLAVRRQIRRIHLFKKLQTAVDDAGFEPQQIPDNIWIPALLEASLQDDETIQGKWANLLANAADPRQMNAVSPSFPEILKELTAREARFLDSLYENTSKPSDHQRRRPPDFVFTSDELSAIYANSGLSRRPRLSNLTVGEVHEGGDDLRADRAEFAATIDILIRNGILRESTEPEPIELSRIASRFDPNRLPRSVDVTAKTQYNITELGTQFVRACRAPV